MRPPVCTQRWILIVRRFTDFLVYEVDQDSSVVHIKSLGMPKPLAKKAKDLGEPVSEVNVDVTSEGPSVIQESTEAELAAEASAGAVDNKDGSGQISSTMPWPDLFSTRLAPFLSAEKIEEIKQMFLEGPEPPFVSDAGWSGRSAAKANENGGSGSMDIEENTETKSDDKGKKGSSKRGRDRGGRGGRGGRPAREDHRKVISEVCMLSPAHPIVLQTSRTTADCLEANAHQLPPNDTRIVRRKVGQRD